MNRRWAFAVLLGNLIGVMSIAKSESRAALVRFETSGYSKPRVSEDSRVEVMILGDVKAKGLGSSEFVVLEAVALSHGVGAGE